MLNVNATTTILSISHTIWAYLAQLTVRGVLVIILRGIAEGALGSAIAAAGMYIMFTLPERKRDSKRMANYLTNTVSLELSSRNKRFVSGERNAVKFDFPSLPPEIRNQIMWYALVEEHIYLPQIREVALLPPSKHCPRLPFFERLRQFFQSVFRQSVGYQISSHISITKLPYVPPKVNHSAAGLLAVNSQIYQQAHGIYWSANNFHLARGDFRNSQAFFENIAPEHLALIKHLTIDLSLADLTPPMFRYLELALPLRNGGVLPRDEDCNEWPFWVSCLLWFIWKDKIFWVREHFGHVPNDYIVCFEDAHKVLKLKGSELEGETAELTDRPPYYTELRSLMGNAMKNEMVKAGYEVHRRLRAVGWDNFKEILAGGGWEGRVNLGSKSFSMPSDIRY